jgi:hypothetical protein
VKSVFVEEGGVIYRSQVLAQLEKPDYRAQVQSEAAPVLS